MIVLIDYEARNVHQQESIAVYLFLKDRKVASRKRSREITQTRRGSIEITGQRRGTRFLCPRARGTLPTATSENVQDCCKIASPLV